jgi:hypothetical protein
MTCFGYPAMYEQTPVRPLVSDLAAAKQDQQEKFLAWAESELLPAVRDSADD